MLMLRLLSLLSLLAPAALAAPPPPAPLVAPPGPPAAPLVRIVATVNHTPITNLDIDNRARLFALSAGLKLSPDVLDRLRPQILRQLIDERIRMQAVERAHIVVPTKAIADAIAGIEKRNGMAPGTLRKRLAARGVGFTTLVDQVRTQLGWTQLLREQLGSRGRVSDAAVKARQALLAARNGQTEYNAAEIFLPAQSAHGKAEAGRFAATVIGELRAGAPFAVTAAEFSQSQTALAGGSLGWVTANQLDPAVARIVAEMPPGAVSDPIAVPGGLDIVTLLGKRTAGQDIQTVLDARQAFLPFSTPLNPNAPTPAQVALLAQAHRIAATVNSCPAMEAAAVRAHSPRPANPGPINLAQVQPPAFRQMLASQPIGKPTQPLVAPDGIAVLIICGRTQKNVAELTPQQIRLQILEQRVDLLSRQLQQDLRSQADIETFPPA